MKDWLNRTKLLIGDEALEKLKASTVIVFGCGGVGSYTIEALVRSGIGNLIIVDNDTVDVTNINRQLIADTKTIGKPKVEVMKRRALNINPDIQIKARQEFMTLSNVSNFIPKECDYIVDAIDTVKSKVAIVAYSDLIHVPIISSMGTGNKLNPTMFEVADISKTSVCPLAKIMRKELKVHGIKHLKVVYSKEEPSRFINNEETKKTPASISFMPSTAGLIIASEVVKDLIYNSGKAASPTL